MLTGPPPKFHETRDILRFVAASEQRVSGNAPEAGVASNRSRRDEKVVPVFLWCGYQQR